MKNLPNTNEYKIEEVDSSFSMFAPNYTVKATGQPVLCMIEGCSEKADWQVNVVTKKNTSILICWKHHSEASDKGTHGNGAMKYILGEAEAKRRGET